MDQQNFKIFIFRQLKTEFEKLEDSKPNIIKFQEI